MAYTANHLIYGSIPSCIVTLPLLNIMRLSGNGIQGELPKVYFNRSRMTYLDLSYNRLTGTVYKLTIEKRYLAVVYTWYSLIMFCLGTIPIHLQQMSNLAYLDLSENRLSGNIELMNMYHLEYSQANETVMTLSLHGNRLSGELPGDFHNAEYINILRGNMFGCLFRNELPKNDPYVDSFFCGSEELSLSLILPFALLLILLVGRWLPVCVCSTKPISESSSSAASWRKYDIVGMYLMQTWSALKFITGYTLDNPFTLQIPGAYGNSLAYTEIFFQTLYDLCVLSMVVSLSIVLLSIPLYTVLKTINNGTFKTHQYQYGWIISGAWMEGSEPARAILGLVVVFMCTLAMFQQWFDNKMRDRVMQFENSKTTPEAGIEDKAVHGYTAPNSDDERGCVRPLSPPIHNVGEADSDGIDASDEVLSPTSRFYVNIAWRIGQFAFNVGVVLVCNILYVVSERGGNIAERYLAVLAIGAFKVVWNNSVVRMLALNILLLPRKLYETDNEFAIGCTFQYLCIIFNVLLAPCIAICVANGNCFANVFIQTDPVEIELSYPVCTLSLAVDRNFSIVPQNDVTTQDCLTETTSAPYQEPFYPPFLYSFQCSSALVSAYAPAFIIQYALAGFIVPLMEFFVWRSIRSHLSTDETKNRDKSPNYSPSYIDVITCKLCAIDRMRYGTLGIIIDFFWPVSEILSQKYGMYKHTNPRYREESLKQSLGPSLYQSFIHSIVESQLSASDGHHDPSMVSEMNVDSRAPNAIHNQRFSPSRNKIFAIIGALSVMLSFGVVYPPLALVIAGGILNMTLVQVYIVQSHINECADDENELPQRSPASVDAADPTIDRMGGKKSEADFSVYSIALSETPSSYSNNNDNDGVFEQTEGSHSKAVYRAFLCLWLENDCHLLHTVYNRAFYCILISSSFFYSLYFYDMSSGSPGAAATVLIVSLLISVLRYVVYYYYKDRVTGSGDKISSPEYYTDHYRDSAILTRVSAASTARRASDSTTSFPHSVTPASTNTLHSLNSDSGSNVTVVVNPMTKQARNISVVHDKM